MDPDKTYDPSKIPIPVKDAYYQLINNNVLSLMDMSQEGASDIEKQIYSKYRDIQGIRYSGRYATSFSAPMPWP